MVVLCVVCPVAVSHHDCCVWSVLWVCLIMTVLCVVRPVAVSYGCIVCGQTCGHLMTVLCVVRPVDVSYHDYRVIRSVGVSYHGCIVCDQTSGCVLS